jgi:hypothetical protein
LFPSLTFRRGYDALVERDARSADLEYLRILQLAAMTLESAVEAALGQLLAGGAVPSYERVKARVVPEAVPRCPELAIVVPDLRAYDALIGAAAVP